MNRKSFVITLSLLLPFSGFAAQQVKLKKSDFTHADERLVGNESNVLLRLSKSGAKKMQELNRAADGHVEVQLAGSAHHLKLRGPIVGKGVEIGPFPQAEAEKIVAEVNGE